MDCPPLGWFFSGDTLPDTLPKTQGRTSVASKTSSRKEVDLAVLTEPRISCSRFAWHSANGKTRLSWPMGLIFSGNMFTHHGLKWRVLIVRCSMRKSAAVCWVFHSAPGHFAGRGCVSGMVFGHVLVQPPPKNVALKRGNLRPMESQFVCAVNHINHSLYHLIYPFILKQMLIMFSIGDK